MVQDSLADDGETFDRYCWVEGTYTKKPLKKLCQDLGEYESFQQCLEVWIICFA